MKYSAYYLGVKSHVVAIDKTTGQTLWKTKLKGIATNGDKFVTLLVDSEQVLAHTCGELFCLDAATGAVLWKNALEGLGYGIASLAVEGRTSSLPESYRLQQQKAAAAAAAAGGSG